MSRELPILAAGSVVRAILSGAQTQDRRPIKALAPLADGSPSYPQYHLREIESDHRGALLHVHNGAGAGLWLSAPWSPGDVLYVRETWRTLEQDDGTDGIFYPADGSFIPIQNTADAADLWGRAHANGKYSVKYRPSLHMPKWAARIRLRVLSVGVERVGEISEADARAEGVADVAAFAALWDSLYPTLPFTSSPWVWVTKFERVLP